jgi:hypothetical protein
MKIKKVITVGGYNLDVAIGNNIKDIRCQIVQDEQNNFHLVVFSSGVKVNNKSIEGKINLNTNDSLIVDNCSVFWYSFFNCEFCSNSTNCGWMEGTYNDGTKKIWNECPKSPYN